jgi:hypothetical protein
MVQRHHTHFLYDFYGAYCMNPSRESFILVTYTEYSRLAKKGEKYSVEIVKRYRPVIRTKEKKI